jgi:hypothetical protein
MNTKLIVKKSADTNYIKVKYSVVEMTVGSNAANTLCVIMTIFPGFDTELNYNKWKSTWNGDYNTLTGRDITGMTGTMGALEVVTLDTIVNYNALTPSRDQ